MKEHTHKQLLKRIQQIWDRHPELRLGQLLVNLKRPFEHSLFSVSDEELLERLEWQYGPFDD